MCGEAPVGLGDELFVEPLLTPAGFVACDEQDRHTPPIEGEGGTPFTVHRFETQLLHVGVFRAFERIRVRAAELRAIIGKEPGGGEQRILNARLEGEEFRLESIVEFDISRHI
jgi:hypothetical protein